MFQDFFDHGAVLALELAREVGRRHLIGPLVDRDAKHAFPVSFGGAGNAPMQPDNRHRGGVAGEPDLVCDLGNDADARKAIPLARHQQHTRVGASLVQRQGDGHAGKYDRIVQRNNSESAHEFRSLLKFGRSNAFSWLDATAGREDARKLAERCRRTAEER